MFRFNLHIPPRFYDEAGSTAGGTGSGPATLAPAASSSAASTPAAGTSPASATGTTTPPASGTTPPATPAPDDLADGNWKELRTRYEAQKAEIATLKSQSTQAAAVTTHAQNLAKTLGYTDQDFAEAFTADPVKTLSILNQEAAARPASDPNAPPDKGDLTKQIEDAVNAKLTPIQEFQNRQTTEVAMTKYNTTVDGLIKADPILATAPPEIVDIVKDYMEEYFSTQPEILLAMKTKGDFSSVPDTLKFVVGRLHGGFKAWLAKSGPQQATGTGAPAAPNGKFSLDDIINDPSVLGKQYK